MSARLLGVLAVAVPFVVFSLWVSWEYGYVTLFSDAFSSPTHLQVFLDLCIACAVSGVWMVGDARKRGLVAWPFVVALVPFGSMSTLAYLVLREVRRQR